MQLPIHCEVSKVNNRLQRYGIFPIYWRDNVAVGYVYLSADNMAVVFCWFFGVCHNVSEWDLVAFGRDFPGVVGIFPGMIAG